MIRYYPNGYMKSHDWSGTKPSFYLLKNPRNPDLCIVYKTKEESNGWGESSLFAFYSPTLQRWLKGGMSGGSVRDTLIVATMDTENEAILIAEGCSAMKLGTEDFKMKMFLLAGEVIEKEEDLPPPTPSSNPTSNYLDDLADEYGNDPSDWKIHARHPAPHGGEYLHLQSNEAEIFAEVDGQALERYHEIGKLTFGLAEYDDTMMSHRTDGKNIIAMFAFNDECSDQEIDWVLEHHYGLDMTFMSEVSENQFDIEGDDDIDTIRTKIEAMGAKFDPSMTF